MKQTTYGERVRKVAPAKQKLWKEKSKNFALKDIAEYTFRSRATINSAINHGICSESTEQNIDIFFNSKSH